MSLDVDSTSADIAEMDIRNLLLDAAKDGQTARCAATMHGSNIGDIMVNAIQAGRLARLQHFTVILYSAARLAAYSHVNWFDVECYQMNKEQIDLIVAALGVCGHEVTVWQKSSVLKNAAGTDVKKEVTTVLRIQTFPPHVREHVAPIWQARLGTATADATLLGTVSGVEILLPGGETKLSAPAPSEV